MFSSSSLAERQSPSASQPWAASKWRRSVAGRERMGQGAWETGSLIARPLGGTAPASFRTCLFCRLGVDLYQHFGNELSHSLVFVVERIP